VPACTLEAGWVGGCTTNVVAGVLQFSGVNKSFATLSGADGIKVGSFDIIARSVAAGTLNTTISGQIVEVRQANAKVVRSNSPFIAGGELNFDVDTGARRRRRQLLRDFRGKRDEDDEEWLYGRGGPGRRRLLSSPLPGNVYGDSSGDGFFTIADLLFLQQYYAGDSTIGCAAEGGDGCQSRAGLSAWQLQQLQPIGRDGSGARDIPYVVNVFLQRGYFVADTQFAAAENEITLAVRLVGKNNMLVGSPQAGRVLFVLNSTQDELPWVNELNQTYDYGRGRHMVFADLCGACADRTCPECVRGLRRLKR